MTEEKSIQVQPKDDIDLIEGHTNILLIAPHGVETDPFDDIGTAELTRQIQKHLGCSAVINTAFRKLTGSKPEKRNNRIASFEAKVLNLNLVDHAQQVKDFTDKIKKVVDAEGLTYAFWIHGIADGNIEQIGKDVQCLLGYGQPNTKAKPKQKPRLTAEQKTIDTVLKEFEKNGIKTIPAPETSKYRGWEKTYMNQWFLLKKYGFDKVQSIQLEFKKTGCRRPADLEATAKKIADAISTLVPPVEKVTEPADKNEQPADKAQVLEKITDPEEIKGAIEVGKPGFIPEVVEEDPKVEEAYQHLKGIFVKHISKAMLEVGQYLIEQFYGDDYTLAEDKPFTNNKSLNQLFDRLQTETSGNAPKKTWLYDSINLAIAEKKYNKVSVYGKLGHSHKIKVIGQKKLPRETKIELMKKTVDKHWSVLRLQEEINKQKNIDGTKLNEPIPAEHLMKFDTKKLQSFKNRTQNLEKRIKEDLAICQGNLGRIEEAIQQKALSEKKPSKSKEPNIISASRRTDIPACYADWFFNRLKEGFALSRKDMDKKPKKVSLKPEDVRCFVFWTKNPGPMLGRLDELKDYHFYFHFTLTPYGQDIEGAVLPPKDELVETFIQLSQKIGKDKVIWRYDPILLTDKIDIEYHKQQFSNLAERLQGYTDKCVISFIDTGYLSAEVKEQLKLKTITNDLMREIGKELQPIAEKHGMTIETCGEKINLIEFNISPARCIDDRIIGTLIGEKLSIDKDPSQRKACGCVKSIDIGTDDTCKNGCLYCYATKDHKQARFNYHKHDKASPSLIGEIPEDDKKPLE